MPGTEQNWYGVGLTGNNVASLSLSSNHLSGSIPSELGNLSDLEELDFYDNRLSGGIPPGLGNLSNLRSLDLSENLLSGSIPFELSNLSNLHDLDLYNNRLSGSILSQLGNLTNLEYLSLDENQLSGSIPSQLGNLSNLEYFSLYDNQLSGGIPSELGNLSNLRELNLNHNQLGGEIPSSFTNLTQLWVLDIGYNCLSATDPGLRAWLDSNDPDWEAHQNQCGGNTDEITLSRTDLYFGSDGQSSTGAQAVLIGSSGSGTLNWSAAGNVSWLSLNPTSGSGDSVLAVSIVPAGLTAGTYSGTIAITAPNATNSPQTAAVTLTVYTAGGHSSPFGTFETPTAGATVRSSIPVTGWALDDIAVAGVKIYRGENSQPVFLGDAVLVEGARPDVEQAYPTYPLSYRAGWGYMMLTNFLPNGGNGPFTLYAIATDVEGNPVTLGSKAINCDNANAVKPFGAIDTPTQGGMASGSGFINWGWVLTPQPNAIPTNGATINVYVDGVNLGHPTYNIYRSDIASLFPGYANTNGAVGYFSLDTTAYENGVHTIQWTATDDAGNNDGIGSRYFTIQNTGAGQASSQQVRLFRGPFPGTPLEDSEPIRVRTGYSEFAAAHEIYPDSGGMLAIEIKELDRLQIYLSPSGSSEISTSNWIGAQVSGDRLGPLPVGSTLDKERGIFYWQPGPGYLGEYLLVFVERGRDAEMRQKTLRVKILPKF